VMPSPWRPSTFDSFELIEEWVDEAIAIRRARRSHPTGPHNLL
jgi:hypothetical protein